MLASLHKCLESFQRTPPELQKNTEFMPHLIRIKTVLLQGPVFKKERKPFNLFPLWFTSPSKGILLVNVTNMMWIKWISQFGITNIHMKMTCFNTTLSLWSGDSLICQSHCKDEVCVFAFLAQNPHSVILLPSLEECDNFYTQRYSQLYSPFLISTCPMPSQLPRSSSNALSSGKPSLPASSWTEAMFCPLALSDGLELCCFSCVRVTGYAPFISLLGRESCMVHLCAPTDTHVHYEK